MVMGGCGGGWARGLLRDLAGTSCCVQIIISMVLWWLSWACTSLKVVLIHCVLASVCFILASTGLLQQVQRCVSVFTNLLLLSPGRHYVISMVMHVEIGCGSTKSFHVQNFSVFPLFSWSTVHFSFWNLEFSLMWYFRFFSFRHAMSVSEGLGLCEHICKNANSSYTCSCRTGYT